MNAVIFIIDAVLKALVPIIVALMFVLMLVPTLMFDYVLPAEVELLKQYKEAKK